MKAGQQDTPLYRPIASVPPQRNSAGILRDTFEDVNLVGTCLHADEYFGELLQAFRKSCTNPVKKGAGVSIGELPIIFSECGRGDICHKSWLAITPGFQRSGSLKAHHISPPPVEYQEARVVGNIPAEDLFHPKMHDVFEEPSGGDEAPQRPPGLGCHELVRNDHTKTTFWSQQCQRAFNEERVFVKVILTRG